jgi:hypothetical protein
MTFELANFKGLDWSHRWEDLRFPAQGINPTGPASPPDVSADDGSLLFDAVTDQAVAIIAQMPHSWDAGTSIFPHVHWSKSTSAAGTVAWKCEYTMANPGGTFPAFQELATVTTTVNGTPDGNTADEHLISTFGELDMTGMEISCIIKFKVTRDASEGTYAADAKLLEFDVHYLNDRSGGSVQQFTKQGTP